MMELLAELEAENAAAQPKNSKGRRKKTKKKGVPDVPRVHIAYPMSASFYLFLLFILLLLMLLLLLREDLTVKPEKKWFKDLASAAPGVFQ